MIKVNKNDKREETNGVDDEKLFCMTLPKTKTFSETFYFKLNDFKPIQILGSGNFGQVYLVGINGKGVYALKKLSKSIYSKAQMCKVFLERKVHILGTLENNPFIVKMYASFHTHDYLYILMECAVRGSLKQVINVYYYLNLDTIRFYAGCCLLGLEFLHKLEIVHRDIKPDNILIDQRGYAKLSDFGISKPNVNWFKYKKTLAGTLDYCAPEVLSKLNYNNSIDFWSLGITIYKMVLGKNPFHFRLKIQCGKAHAIDKDFVKNEIKRCILYSPIWYSTCDDFKSVNNLIRRLTRRAFIARLGNGPNGIQNIKMHNFFSKISWNNLASASLVPPFLPPFVIDENILNDETNMFDNYCDNLLFIEDINESIKQKEINETNDFDNFNIVFSDWLYEEIK